MTIPGIIHSRAKRCSKSITASIIAGYDAFAELTDIANGGQWNSARHALAETIQFIGLASGFRDTTLCGVLQ